MKKIFFSLFVVLISFPVFSLAGVVVESQRSAGDGSITREKIQAEGNAVRVDSEGANAHTSIIFRKDKSLMWIVDHSKKTYQEMTKADFEKMAQAMKGAMNQMQKQMAAQLDKMPPAQRAEVEKMMKSGQMPQAKTVEAAKEIKKTGATQKVGDWTCEIYEMISDGKKDQTLCVANWNQLSATRDDFQAFESMADFFSDLAGGMSQDVGQSQQIMKDLMDKGIPVRQSFEGGQGSFVQEVSKIEKKSIEVSLFELPQGYTKESIPWPK